VTWRLNGGIERSGPFTRQREVALILIHIRNNTECVATILRSKQRNNRRAVHFICSVRNYARKTCPGQQVVSVFWRMDIHTVFVG
jgi:hypothetical protein